MTIEKGKELAPLEASRGAVAIPDTQNLRALATEMLNSDFFASIKKAPQAMAIILHGAEIGLTPTVALQTISIVNGRMCISTTVLQALFQSKGGKVKVLERSEESAKVEFSKKGLDPYVHEYTKRDAELEGLWGKDNWRKRPKTMLLYRCVSGGLRVYDPGAFLGIMTSEEMQDYPGGFPDEPVQVGGELPEATQTAPESQEPIKKKGPGRPKAEKPTPEAAPEPEKPREAPKQAKSEGFEAAAEEIAAMAEPAEADSEEEQVISKIKAALEDEGIDIRKFKEWLWDTQPRMKKTFLVKLGKAIRFHGAVREDLEYLLRGISGAIALFRHWLKEFEAEEEEG